MVPPAIDPMFTLDSEDESVDIEIVVVSFQGSANVRYGQWLPRVFEDFSTAAIGELVGVASVIEIDVALVIGKLVFLLSRSRKAPLDIACCS